MPVLDEATFGGRRASSLPSTGSTSTGTAVKLPNGVAKPSAAPLVDLLDLSDDAPAPSSSGGDFLQDLLGVDLAPGTLSGRFDINLGANFGTNSYVVLICCEFFGFLKAQARHQRRERMRY